MKLISLTKNGCTGPQWLLQSCYICPPPWQQKLFKGILADMLTDKYPDPQATPLSPIL